MNDAPLRKSKVSQSENDEIIDFLKYKENKSEHVLYPQTYVYSEDFFQDIKKIVKALENSTNKNIINNTKSLGNVKNNGKRIKLGGILINNNCNESWEELKLLNLKYENSIPKVTICYMAFSAFAAGVFAVLVLLSITKGINILHPVTSLLFFIGFIGLFVTAYSSIKDWRNLLNDIKR